MPAPGSPDPLRIGPGRRRPAIAAGALAILAASGSVAVATTPRPPPPPTKATACGVFTLADARLLIGAAARPDPSASHTVDFAGQRNTQCGYSAGANGLADLQMLIPLNGEQAAELKISFEDNQSTDQGTILKGIGAAAFWKSKVGTPAVYVLTASDVTFDLGATTTGSNSASEAKLEQVAKKIVKALG